MKKQLLALATVVTFSGIGFGQNPFAGINEAIMSGRIGVSFKSEAENNWDRGTIFSNIKWNDITKKWESSSTSRYRDFGMIRFKNGSAIGFYSANPGKLDDKVTYSNVEMNKYERMTITQEGNIGIGIQFPSEAKFVINHSSDPSLSGAKTGTMALLGYNTELAIGASSRLNGASWLQVRHKSNVYPNAAYTLALNPLGGNVGIGTTSPDEKLTVKGKIHAEEVRVDLSVPADYVFEKYYTGKSELKADYVMPTLEEVEAFTKANNHLPNIPSAQEIQAEGLHLKQMTNLLLQKVEELTLYTIEQQKEIKALKAKVTQLEKE